ncbi:hypothetical protein BBJ28_00019873 [Nothophytophthora sp. Chile5]|nr:hypothetical protein BBJ28_00019873 [Nothophytophthora sp. Chile5]
MHSLPTASAIGRLRRDSGPLFTESLLVRTLDVESYEAMLNDTTAVWLVDFYSPWCPHCRHFAPEWEEAAKLYNNSDSLHFGAADCTQHKDVCDRENIFAYPGVKMFHVPPEAEEAIKMDPKGRKKAKDVVGWIEEKLAEHGMKSGVDLEGIYPQNKVVRSNAEHGVSAFSKQNEPMYRDQSVDMKYKRLRDAGTTAMFTFENSFFMGTTVLEGERYDAALMWVEALAAAFPMEENRAALMTLADGMKQQKRWDQTDWNQLLKKWKPVAQSMSYPTNLFKSGDELAFCTTYTCGLWTLFHSISVSDAKIFSLGKAWKPSSIMAAIRLFVKYFFGCEECRQHFLMANPEGVIKKLATSDAEGPHAVVLWIWKMHNTVNKVLTKGQWPSRDACPTCYVENGKALSLDEAQLHEDEIVAYVTSVYRHEDQAIFERRGMVAALRSSMQGFTSLLAVLFLFALLAAVFKARRHGFVSMKEIVARDHIA